MIFQALLPWVESAFIEKFKSTKNKMEVSECLLLSKLKQQVDVIEQLKIQFQLLSLTTVA